MANRFIESTFGTPGNFELVTRDGGNPAKLVHLWRGSDFVWQPELSQAANSSDLISSNAGSPGAIIQSSFGTPDHPGNFEVLVLEGTDLVHYYRDNSNPSSNWQRTRAVSDKATGAASFIQSNLKGNSDAPGNFEAVVLEGANLVHYYRDNSIPEYPWISTSVITSQARSPGCIIQSNLGPPGSPGNFEVVVLEPGGLVHYFRDNSTQDPQWNRTTVISTEAASSASIIQSNLGPGNLELVVLEGEALSEQKSLVHYYRSNDTWIRTVTISPQSQGPACLIQSRYGTPGNFEVVVLEGVKGAHALIHYWRDNGVEPPQWQSGGVVTQFPFDSVNDG
ncbi:hypothetical protein GP486_004708 [Trichoglossum hirsutum]|uniref:Fucose-specific lectin n=1 Tax=Trichoglossum hirsutum TaxID=265104 RepID=A0A9P8RNL4_9PEZI|nr:hypothetical protein GP486_004708 [Trichoglossum hirsutum]